jgi:hypothetical protein
LRSVDRRAGRANRQDDITVFKNNGLAVEFVALAAKVYRLAVERGARPEIPANYFSGLRTWSGADPERTAAES